MNVRYTSAALEDLRAALVYLHARNPQAAAKLGDHLEEVIENLAVGWLDGAEETLADGQRVRSWAVPPLRVYYQRSADGLVVLRIYDQRRKPLTTKPPARSRPRRRG